MVPREASPEGDALGFFLLAFLFRCFDFFFFFPSVNPKLPTRISPNPALLGNN